MNKLILRIFLIALIGYVLIFLFDLFLMSNNTKPIIVLDTYSYEYDNIYYTEYLALGYKVTIKEEGFIKESSIDFAWTDTMPDIKFIIRDETGEYCPTNKTIFYEDAHYEYSFTCDKKIYIEIDRKKYELKDALEEGLVTIDELEEHLFFKTTSKVLVSLETKQNSCSEFEFEEEHFIEQGNGIYYYCMDDVNIYVNSSYYSFIEAYEEKVSLDSILVNLTESTNYENGEKMYTDLTNNVLVCSNGDVVIGPEHMIYYDEFCR